MKKIILASVAVLVLAGSTAVYAQHRPWWFNHHHVRMNPEDRAAFADARIAAVHAGLKLTPDQEKLWPVVESAVRDFAKLRIDRANAMMDGPRDGARDPQPPTDPIGRLRDRAERMGATATALKRIADAADPLYKTLDEGQKRRLAVLTHMQGRFGGPPMGGFEGRHMEGRGFMHRGDDHDDGDRDFRPRNYRGPDRDLGPEPDRL